MEEITVTVENDFGDACGDSLLSDILTYLGSNLALCTFLDTLGRSCADGLAGEIVDELNVNLLVAAEHRHAGTLGGAGNLAADAGRVFFS